jgi:hypothetical protein
MGIFTAIGGLMMNLYVLGTCLFQRITPLHPVTGEPMKGEERGYGFLSRETDYGLTPDYRQCSWYTRAEYDELFDGWMHFGRIFAFASAILASICFVVMFLTCCVAFSPSMFEKWLFWMYVSAALTVAFSFLIFGSEYCADNKCKVADGCGWAISAFMFHLLAANTVKSVAAPSAPPPKRNTNSDDGDDDEDEIDDLDDLYYDNEENKYPPPHPDGPRGVVVDKNGIKEYDDGEDYYNEMGRLIPDDERGDYQRARKADNEDDDLDDISDHDLDEYASDNEEDELDENGNKRSKSKPQYDEYGNPIYDPDTIDQTGNLGVGYDDNDSRAHTEYDEHGNRVQRYDAHGNPIYYDDEVDEFGNPIPSRGVDEYGNSKPDQVDEFGNPVYSDQQSSYDDFVNASQHEQALPGYDTNAQQQQPYDTDNQSRYANPPSQWDENGTTANGMDHPTVYSKPDPYGANDNASLYSTPDPYANGSHNSQNGHYQQPQPRRNADDDSGPVFT